MIVMKFGGTSVEDAGAMRKASVIISDRIAKRPLIVASACAGVTNSLIGLAREASSGDGAHALQQVEILRHRHRAIAAELFDQGVLPAIFSQIDFLHDELRDLAKSISVLGELTPRSLDAFSSYGERLSTFLLWHKLTLDGTDAVLVNAREVMITNNDFTRAVPYMEKVRQRALERMGTLIQAGRVVVTQGYIGGTEQGIVTTLGRGGSDYSAAIFGAVLGAEEIQIWTDVDGIMTSDPSKIPAARLISEMTFREAAELAYFGAKILHPATILPAVEKGIPVRVLNSRRPDGSGTLILRAPVLADNQGARAIAYKTGISLVNIDSTRMLGTHGFLARVFEVFARFEKSVDVIATSEVSVSLTVDSEDHLEAIATELRQIAEVDIASNMAVFCVVGENLRRTPGFLSKIFGVLDREKIGVRMVSLGASEINVTFVVGLPDMLRTAKALHAAFFEG